MTAPRRRLEALDVSAHAACALVALALLIAAGQPIFTDDLWWHLGLGRAFSREGPWLAADPLLFTAPGPPSTASWLAQVALFWIWQHAGFAGLRVAHACGVVAILAIVWTALRHASRSRAIASAGTLAFVCLSAYRLAQLRPELVTLAATPLLYRLSIEPEAPVSARRILVCTLLVGLWANAHPAFPLGLAMLGAAGAAMLVAAPMQQPARRAALRRRGVRILAALAACTAASFANPGLSDPHLAWFRAGDETPALARVGDEWTRFEPLRIPLANLPPTPLAFALQWGIWISIPIAVVAALRRRRRSPHAAVGEVDPGLAAWSAACLAAPLLAVRFLWLGLFPLLLLARSAPGGAAPRRAAALLACALVPGFFARGDWRMISNLLPRAPSGYAQPYTAAKYYAHAIWFLEDAGVAGNVWCDYAQGSFLGFFGAPARKAFLNGSLNVTREAIEANLPIRERRGLREGESFLELLDRMQIDVFVGTRLPQENPSRRPWFYTTAHLENAPGWLPVFRNLDSAVYVRENERNAGNLARIAAHFAQVQVPFDAVRGFDPEQAIRDARGWSVAHGVVPVGFAELAAAEGSVDPELRSQAARQLAALYASLGLYEHLLRLDRRTLRAQPDAVSSRRRVVWSLLRLGRRGEADVEAAALRATPEGDRLSHAIAEAAAHAARDGDPERTASQIARLPVLSAGEASLALYGVLGPEPRRSPRDASSAD